MYQRANHAGRITRRDTLPIRVTADDEVGTERRVFTFFPLRRYVPTRRMDRNIERVGLCPKRNDEKIRKEKGEKKGASKGN